jgi:pyruvate dehydrogenase E1 component
MDEPESLGAITLAAREKLNNLNFVINCNLQRLDGPVRGNGKIIQELEALFRGAGWNVVKVIWGSGWDKLLAKDKSGLLIKRMEEVLDGDYQRYKSKDGAFVRKHFFGKYPELLDLVADMSDSDIWKLERGGHDPRKIFAAYAQAAKQTERPTVILAKSVKGYGMGDAGEGQNTTHSQKKMGVEQMRRFRDRFGLPVSDDDLEQIPLLKLEPNGEELRYLHERRKALGGYLPSRQQSTEVLEIPELEAFDSLLKSTESREISTTMAFVRILSTLARDKKIGKRIVPIVPDEARTFGMEGMFRQLGIYSSSGQLYEPEDHDKVMWYREDKKGQILQEGINEAGAMAEWMAAATSYANHGIPMIPFYIYYSMFGFQRVGDFAWAAGDIQARGFLIGATAGRTTLNGEGLQHQDGNSFLHSGLIPNCVSYDPTYSYEMAVIIQDGLRRMYQQDESVFYYITALNENYPHPDMPKGCEAGILRGIYPFSKGGKKKKRVQLLGSGAILREVEAAAALLETDWKVSADVWSATSFIELKRDGDDASRWNRLHPEAEPRKAYVTQVLEKSSGPIIAATDYVQLYAEQIRPYMPRSYTTLGTDGYGRSDTREALRKFFEVDRHSIVVAALKALADEGEGDYKTVSEAINKYGINADSPNPMTL